MHSIAILFVAFVLAVGGSLFVYPTSPSLAQMANTTSSKETGASSTTNATGRPIYGVLDSCVEANGRDLISDAREAALTAGETVSDTGENVTESAEQVGNQTGQFVENVINTTGNIIGGLGDSVTDLFTGTDN